VSDPQTSVPPVQDFAHATLTPGLPPPSGRTCFAQHTSPPPQLVGPEHESAVPVHVPFGVQASFCRVTQHSCAAGSHVALPHAIVGATAASWGSPVDPSGDGRGFGPADASLVGGLPGGGDGFDGSLPPSTAVPGPPPPASSDPTSATVPPQPHARATPIDGAMMRQFMGFS
jgi:hypothetical protein